MVASQSSARDGTTRTVRPHSGRGDNHSQGEAGQLPGSAAKRAPGPFPPPPALTKRGGHPEQFRAAPVLTGPRLPTALCSAPAPCLASACPKARR
jgi:hypothetical protein